MAHDHDHRGHIHGEPDFGRAFALRFAPATFVLAVAGGLLTGAVLL